MLMIGSKHSSKGRTLVSQTVHFCRAGNKNKYLKSILLNNFKTCFYFLLKEISIVKEVN